MPDSSTVAMMPTSAPVRPRAPSTISRSTVSNSRLVLMRRIAAASFDARSRGAPSVPSPCSPASPCTTGPPLAVCQLAHVPVPLLYRHAGKSSRHRSYRKPVRDQDGRSRPGPFRRSARAPLRYQSRRPARPRLLNRPDPAKAARSPTLPDPARATPWPATTSAVLLQPARPTSPAGPRPRRTREDDAGRPLRRSPDIPGPQSGTVPGRQRMPARASASCDAVSVDASAARNSPTSR